MAKKEIDINIKVNDKEQILTNPQKTKDNISDIKTNLQGLKAVESQVFASSIKNLKDYSEQIDNLNDNFGNLSSGLIENIQSITDVIPAGGVAKKEAADEVVRQADKNMRAAKEYDGIINAVANILTDIVSPTLTFVKEAVKGIIKFIQDSNIRTVSTMTGQIYSSEANLKEGNAEYVEKMESYIETLQGEQKELTKAVLEVQKEIALQKGMMMEGLNEHRDNYADAKSEYTFWAKNILTNSDWQQEAQKEYKDAAKELRGIYEGDLLKSINSVKQVLEDIAQNTSDPSMKALVTDLMYQLQPETKELKTSEYLNTILQNFAQTAMEIGYDTFLKKAEEHSKLLNAAGYTQEIVDGVVQYLKLKDKPEASPQKSEEEFTPEPQMKQKELQPQESSQDSSKRPNKLPTVNYDKESGRMRIDGYDPDFELNPKPASKPKPLKSKPITVNTFEVPSSSKEQDQRDLEEVGKAEAAQKNKDLKSSIKPFVPDNSNIEIEQNDLKELESIKQKEGEIRQKAADVAKQSNDTIVESTAKTAESQKEHWKKIHAIMQEHAEAIATGTNAVFSGLSTIFKDQLADAEAKYQDISQKHSEVVEKRKESNDRLNDLEEQAKNARGGRSLILQEQINQEMQKNQELAQQEAQLAKQKEKAEKEKVKKEKQIKKAELSQNIIQGVANTALGVTKAWALGPFVGPIMASLVGIAGAIQVAVMSKQLSKLEDGGLLRGRRHTQGGMRIEGTNIEVEGGEYVVNRESTSKNIGLVRYINSQRKELTQTDVNHFFAKTATGYEPPFRTAFAAGGQMPAINNTVSVDNDLLVDAIKSIKFEPKVAVTDIIRAQDEAVHVDGWTGM